jgi:hypothetical protein
MNVTDGAYGEIVELFARGSSADEIIEFRPSSTAQDRVRYLLDRNRSGGMTDDEASELERFSQLEHMMQLVKAHARSHAGTTT